MTLTKRRRTYWSESDFTTQLTGIGISGSQVSRIVDALQRFTDDVSELIGPSMEVDLTTSGPMVRLEFAPTMLVASQEEGWPTVTMHASQSSHTERKQRKPICPMCEETIWDDEAKLVCQCCKEWTHDVKREWTPQRGWHGCYDSKRDQCQFCTEIEYKAYKTEQLQKKGRYWGFHQWEELVEGLVAPYICHYTMFQHYCHF